MKKSILFFLTIAFCNFIFAAPIQDRNIDSVALLQLASVLEIPEDSDLVEETQKRWLRKHGLERWEISELLSLGQRDFVLDWAKKQGLLSSWKPIDATYDKALILGATTSRMQMRLDYLKNLWNEGVRFHEIVWLTGERPLDHRADNLLDRSKNESEAAYIIWEETTLPEEMRQLPVTFISVPMKKDKATLKRPNTADTIVAWLDTSVAPCKALFVSDQPFCGYQFAVIKSILPNSFSFDLVGQGVEATSHPAAASIILDSIARWIYQEDLISQSQINNSCP